MRGVGVGAPPKGGGQGSVWFAIAAATGGLVTAIGTSIVAHDRALETEPPKADVSRSAARESPEIEPAAVPPDASTPLSEAERAYVKSGR